MVLILQVVMQTIIVKMNVKIKKIHISNASNNPLESKQIKAMLASYASHKNILEYFL